jgi:excisionase family DNA binding protein
MDTTARRDIRGTKQTKIDIEAGRVGITDRIERMPHALTVRELKTLLQVSDQTIYRMIADKTIPFLTVRNSYRFDPKQIAEWLRQRSMSA